MQIEIIAFEVIFLGGIRQSRLAPDYYLAEVEEQLPAADGGDVPIDERQAALRED